MNQFGTATVTVTVSDGSLMASRDFLLTVNPVERCADDRHGSVGDDRTRTRRSVRSR